MAALRGSMTARTPTVDTIRASRRVHPIGSCSSQKAISSTKAGVAEVTREPLAAVLSLGPDELQSQGDAVTDRSDPEDAQKVASRTSSVRRGEAAPRTASSRPAAGGS